MKATFEEVHAAYEAEMRKAWSCVRPEHTVKEAMDITVPRGTEVLSRYGWTSEEYHEAVVKLVLG